MDDGGEVFPTDLKTVSSGYGGMSIRVWLAGKAMEAIMQSTAQCARCHSERTTEQEQFETDVLSEDEISKHALIQADSMIAEIRRTEKA